MTKKEDQKLGNSWIQVCVPKETTKDKLYSKRVEVLDRAVATRFPTHTTGIGVCKTCGADIRVYSFDCKLKTNNLNAMQAICEIANGLFDLDGTVYSFLGIEEEETNKSLYETRHWFQGTGHENALIN